jgi:two-component system nitrogen regulation response regulator NtrX
MILSSDIARPPADRIPVPDDGAAPLPSLFDRSITPFRDARAAFEREFITRALKTHDWNVSRTAEALGLERSHLHRKIKLLAIELRPDAPPRGGSPPLS